MQKKNEIPVCWLDKELYSLFIWDKYFFIKINILKMIIKIE